MRNFSLGLLVLLVLSSCQQAPSPTAESRAEPIPAWQSGDWLGVSPEGFPLTSQTPSRAPNTLTGVRPQVYLVEFASPPLASGGSKSAVAREHASFAKAAADATLDYVQRFRYERLFNGVSVAVAAKDVTTLAQLPGVQALYLASDYVRPLPQAEIDLQQLENVRAEVLSAWQLTGVDVAKGDLGLTGRGVRVGIIDDGLDLDHPEFAGRVVASFDFVGDGWDPSSPETAPFNPDNDVDITCPVNGNHGTHVAGIAVGRTVGVAPEAEIGVYKIGDCNDIDSTSFDATIAALERAVEDDMDIVNISSGYVYTWPAGIADRAANEGLIIISSAGNTPTLYAIGTPAADAGIISVASYDNTRVPFVIARRQDGEPVFYEVAQGFADVEPRGVLDDVVYVGRGCKSDPYQGDPNGSTALIIRGGCTFNEKFQRALDEGAQGVIVYNNIPGDAPMVMGAVEPRDDAFAVMISFADGEAIRQALAAREDVSLEFAGELLVPEQPTGGRLSSFSSYGLTPDLQLKPDIGAPGRAIYSAVPLTEDQPATNFAVLSGTSMASSHVAGAVALLLESRRARGLSTSPEQVRTLLQNTAIPSEWSRCDDTGVDGVCDQGYADPTHRQGAGLLNLPAAINAVTTAVPAKLSLGESQQGSVTETITVTNSSNVPRNYDLSALTGVVATDHVLDFWLPETTNVTFDRPTVTVEANSSATFTVTITAPDDVPDGTIYGGFLELSPQTSDSNMVRIPFAGFKGDYQDLPVLGVSPFLTDTDSTVTVDGDPPNVPIYLSEVEVLDPGQRYSMVGDDVPTFAFGLQHQAQRVTAEIIPQGTLSWLGAQPGFTIDLVPRSQPGNVFVFGLGDIDASGLPDGRYTIRITILKAGGNPSNPNHLEIAETPHFFIDRLSD